MLVRFGYTYAIIRNNGYENGMKSSLSACHRRQKWGEETTEGQEKDKKTQEKAKYLSQNQSKVFLNIEAFCSS